MIDLKIFDKPENAILSLAEKIVKISAKSISENGRFNFVLSGGSSPKKLYELLASDDFKNKIDWKKTFFFFGDERFVPADDEQRNSLMVRKALFEPLKIMRSHIFEVDTSVSPNKSAEKYWREITAHFESEHPKFDFILLGLGDNSHTASLFPNTKILSETEVSVRSVFVKEVDSYRITMTAPLINKAENIAFLVYGKDKSGAVFNVLEKNSGTANEYPARLIQPENTYATWFMDKAAASKIKY